MGVAPISDPQVVVLVTLYNPTGEGGHQGGGVGAPVGGKVLSEILPYLEIKKDNEKDEEKLKEVDVPNIEGKIIKEAEKILKEYNLQLQLNEEKENIDREKTVIKNQIPKQGIKIKENSKIIIEI